jgi:cytochrome b pre-mRNA-processing protein 3
LQQVRGESLNLAVLSSAASDRRRTMLTWLKNRSDQRRIARALYGSIVTRAREPTLYAAWGVPDTMQGRFEMIALHLALLLRRLAREGAAEGLARALTEAFVEDLDDAMREMTFGDLAVPREVKRAAAALFDRYRAYMAALETGEEGAMTHALRSQLAYADPGGTLDATSLSRYVRRAASALDQQPAPLILGGQLAWPRLVV